MKKNLVVILAREGSKRIINKNFQIIGKKSLILRTIELAKKFKNSDIIISTDSKKIAKIAKTCNIRVPWLRPKNISKDDSSSSQAITHILKMLKNKISSYKGLILLQPTSPYRNLKKIKKIITLFEKNISKNFVAVSKFKYNAKNLYEMNEMNKKLKRIAVKKKINNLYYVNGSFYIISIKEFLRKKSFISKNTHGFDIDNFKESIDIDTHEDLILAKKIL
jgi:CMP-N,N'-diacetyllegionaminic acid synthase